MAAVANLKSSQLAAQPGQTISTEVTIVNTGTIVEQFTIMLLGDVAAWATVEPPVVSLFPQGQQTVSVRFSPPRHYLTPAGPVDFAVKVIPANEPEESVVEEGVINVGSFNDVGAELVPRVATGRLSGKQKLAVDSRGNVPVPIEVAAFDAADGMKFSIRPKRVVTAPGEARFARVRVKPRQRFFRGPPQQKPYKVQVAPEGEKPLVLDGSLTQKPVLPKWLLPLLALLALLVLLWFLVLRPIVKSTAVTANAAALAAQAADNKRLSAQLAATQATVAALAGAKPAGATSPTTAKPGSPAAAPGTSSSSSTATTTGASSSTTAGGAASTTTAKGTTPTTQVPPVIGPNDGRFPLDGVASGVTGTSTMPFLGTGATLSVTDLVVQDETPDQPATLQIQRLNQAPGKKTILLEFPMPFGSDDNEQFHFNTPMLFTAGQALQVQLFCNPSDNAAVCGASVYYIGSLSQPGGGPTTVPNIPQP